MPVRAAGPAVQDALVTGSRVEEDWSVEDLDVLLRAAATNLDESIRCHAVGAPHAALVLLAGAFEATLLGMVVAHEDELRAGGGWPARPSVLHLAELAGLARGAGWLPGPVTAEVVEVLNKAPTMAAHPGAYVRAVRQVPELDLTDPAGYAAVYDIVLRASRALFGGIPGSPATGVPVSGPA
jgi:hypothetical protein